MIEPRINHWRKIMNTKHLAPCIAGVAVALVLLVAFGVDSSTLLFLGLVLACPLMMLVMMKGMTRGKGDGSRGNVPSDRDQSHPASHT